MHFVYTLYPVFKADTAPKRARASGLCRRGHVKKRGKAEGLTAAGVLFFCQIYAEGSASVIYQHNCNIELQFCLGAL